MTIQEEVTKTAEATEVSSSDPVPTEQSRVERGDTPYTFGQRVLQSDDYVWNHNAWLVLFNLTYSIFILTT